MSRSEAVAIGLLPAAGQSDFDDQGNRLGDELVTDPEVVVRTCAWRDLAVHHSALENAQGAVA